MSRVGKNDPCPCGSGKKHKQCCMHFGREELTAAFGEVITTDILTWDTSLEEMVRLSAALAYHLKEEFGILPPGLWLMESSFSPYFDVIDNSTKEGALQFVQDYCAKQKVTRLVQIMEGKTRMGLTEAEMKAAQMQMSFWFLAKDNQREFGAIYLQDDDKLIGGLTVLPFLKSRSDFLVGKVQIYPESTKDAGYGVVSKKTGKIKYLTAEQMAAIEGPGVTGADIEREFELLRKENDPNKVMWMEPEKFEGKAEMVNAIDAWFDARKKFNQ